jgi:hypothetical protein
LKGKAMIRFTSALLICLMCCTAVADRPILLVTPQGVYQAEVVNGVPGQWKPMAIDVIVQGFINTPSPPDTPNTPPTDPQILKIAELAKTGLKDKAEATAVAALVDSLDKLGLSDTKLKEALEMAAPIADSSMQSAGRITKFVKSAVVVTTDASKLKAGIVSAWGVEQSTLDAVHSAAQRPTGEALPAEAEALDIVAIIALIQMIIQLLQNLGII